MSLLGRVDHITYACHQGTIEKWAWYHIEVEGGKLVTRIDDVDPSNPNSSMKLWCVDMGEFGIALVEGIDRQDKSQVTLFAELHGDHSVQHVAYETNGSLESFLDRLDQHGCNLLGEVINKKDGFGVLKQVFCRGYSQLNPAQNQFAEYVQRPRSVAEELEITFSQKAGKGFFRQIEEAMASENPPIFTDFSAKPADWQAPSAEPVRRVLEPQAQESEAPVAL